MKNAHVLKLYHRAKKVKDSIQQMDRDRFFMLLLIVIFVASRVLMYFLGFEFDMRFLDVAWQNLDTWLLKTELLQSIWYLHSQPPLFNLFIGVILKLFPLQFAAVFEFIFHCLGLISTVCFYVITKNLTSNRHLSFFVSVFFSLTPSFILFENLFFYDFAVLVVLVGISYLFQRFLRTNKSSDLFIFFLAASLLVLTRRVFHLLWFLVFVGVLIYYYRGEWRRIVLAMLLPLTLIVFWYGKNLYYFGNFDASSWSGMGFFKTATYALTQQERQELYDQGVVSEHVFYGKDPFAIPVVSSAPTDIDEKIRAMPVVGSPTKINGSTNYNYYAYIDLSRQLQHEFISIVKYKPMAYIKGMVVTSIIFFSPASGYFAASENNNAVDFNYQIVKKWDILFNRIVYGQPLSWGGEKLKNYVAHSLNIKKTEAWRLLSPGILLIAVYVTSILYGLRIIFQKNAMTVYRPEVYLMVIFLVLNILYVSAVGILAEAGENQRHRFMIEGLNWILFAFFIQNVILNKKTKG